VPAPRPSTPPPPRIPDHVIRVGGAAALLPLIADRGIDPDPLLAEVGLSSSAFADPDNVVPFAALCRFAKLASERTGLTDIGLRACTRAGLPALGVLGYLVANSESVERGLAALQEYLHIHDQGATSYVVREGDTAVLGYEVLAPGVPGADQMTFGALAIGANILRGLCGSGFRLREVTFACGAPKDVSLLRTFFNAPVRFDAERSALAFDARWLAARVNGANAYIRRVLAEKVSDQIMASREHVEERIGRVVRSLVAAGKFSIDDVAASFAMSRRTLARRLRENGTRFRDLLEDARFRQAQGLLRSSAVPIAEIAARLGYSDTATFTRAFRRWAGTSPGEWRKNGRTI
jgi:AraC-like DNA-binding protein